MLDEGTRPRHSDGDFADITETQIIESVAAAQPPLADSRLIAYIGSPKHFCDSTSSLDGSVVTTAAKHTDWRYGDMLERK